MPGKHKTEQSRVNEAAPLNESGSLKPEQPLKDNGSVDVWLLPNKQQRADGAGHSKIIAVSRLSQEFTEQWWARAVSRVHSSNAPTTSRAGWSQILGIEENFECRSCSNTTQTAHKWIHSLDTTSYLKLLLLNQTVLQLQVCAGCTDLEPQTKFKWTYCRITCAFSVGPPDSGWRNTSKPFTGIHSIISCTLIMCWM